MSRSTAAYRGWETRRERDEAVTVNLAPELLPLWERTKGQFAGPAWHRLQAFLEFAEAAPREQLEALQRAADAKLDELLVEREAA